MNVAKEKDYLLITFYTTVLDQEKNHCRHRLSLQYIKQESYYLKYLKVKTTCHKSFLGTSNFLNIVFLQQ